MRGAGRRIHAEIAGYGSSFDAHGISEPHPEGRGALQAMSQALAEAGVDPGDVDCINAHGTATPKNDPVETLAIKRLFGARAHAGSRLRHQVDDRPPDCGGGRGRGRSRPSSCMKASVVHPTINLDEPDPACDLDYVPHPRARARAALRPLQLVRVRRPERRDRLEARRCLRPGRSRVCVSSSPARAAGSAAPLRSRARSTARSSASTSIVRNTTRARSPAASAPLGCS